MHRTLRLFSCLFVVASLSACSCNGGDGGDDGDGGTNGLLSLEIMPSSFAFEIEAGQTPSTAFTVVGHYEGGRTRDVTNATLTIDRMDIATVVGASVRASGSTGGVATLRASLGSVSATAPITVLLRARVNDPNAMNLPLDPEAPFAGPADAGRNPSVVYPSTGVLLPSNLRELEVHFMPGAGNTLFAIGFHSAGLDLEVYTRCTLPMNGGCIYALDDTVWRYFAQSNRGGTVQVRVRGTNDGGTGVGTSPEIAVELSPDDLAGGLYYWTTFNNTAIMRYDFASTTQTEAELFIDQDESNGQCIGCHTLSREGGKLVLSADGSYNANLLLYDVGRRQPLVPFDSTPQSAFSAFNPDSSRYVGVFSNEDQAGFLSYDLNIFDATTGQHIETIDVNGQESEPTTHPDWSPDGNRIVFVQGLLRNPAGDPDDSTLAYLRRTIMYMITYDAGTSTWGAPVALSTRASHSANYYPTFSPDGDVIVFNHSACPGGGGEGECDMYDDIGAELMMMQPMPGAMHVPLTRANALGPTDTRAFVQSSFPKWAPFTTRRRLGPNPGRLQWVTFSSNRRMGLRVPPDANQTWIWMAAVDPDVGLAGQDPSFPAFLLPFQDLATDNHTAQWAEEIIVID